ncbi:MAG: cereblon family protein [Solidesulfovibrio sp.]|uniref:cereblon family protein n=1 Tax=Solidesulfovibrio sp. TaxID=2910990 RepID=UPI002B205B54|nr:cereblon family protein [Solidesulfovibrio sp.]MEA4855744.1 cereblon family protein [Solidesulfovibrio sp.]
MARHLPPPLLCAACRAAITEERQRIAVAGSHHHVFANPYGRVFEIGCFAAAPGVAATGAASPAFSWFAGTAWRVAVCAACGEHLGWRYDRTAGGFFFGLILDRLVSGATPPTASDH